MFFSDEEALNFQDFIEKWIVFECYRNPVAGCKDYDADQIYDSRKKARPKIAYLSRGKHKRSIANEKEFVEFLERRFEGTVRVVEFTKDTPFLEQVLAFRNADILVAVHGAGLLNTMFMRSESVLVELFPYLMYTRHYQTISKRFGVRHIAWHGSSLDRSVWRPGDSRSANCSKLMRSRASSIQTLWPNRTLAEIQDHMFNAAPEDIAECMRRIDTMIDLEDERFAAMFDSAKEAFLKTERQWRRWKDPREPSREENVWWWWRKQEYNR